MATVVTLSASPIQKAYLISLALVHAVAGVAASQKGWYLDIDNALTRTRSQSMATHSAKKMATIGQSGPSKGPMTKTRRKKTNLTHPDVSQPTYILSMPRRASGDCEMSTSAVLLGADVAGGPVATVVVVFLFMVVGVFV